MMIPAGRLTEQIEIQRRDSTLDSVGEQVHTWATIYVRRAEVRRTPGREVFAAAHVGARVPTVFRLRPQGLDVSPADRVVYDGKVYGIASVVDNGDELLLSCDERDGEVP